MSTPAPEQPAPDPVVRVNARFCSERLQQLHAEYADAKAAVDAAESRLKVITDGIKLELTEALPEGATKAALFGPGGPALSLAYVESWRLNTAKLKAENPLVYATYAKQTGSWRLSVAKGPAADTDGGE